MTKRSRIILLVLLIALSLVFGVLYFAYTFFKAFAPCEVEVSDKKIKSSCGLVNGFSIEKLKVDSIGADNYPAVYTVQYITSCSINQPVNKPPKAPKKIVLDRPGPYTWTEEAVNVPFNHFGRYRNTRDSSQKAMFSSGKENFKTCPLKLEKGQWYFINIYHPSLVGVYLYIGKDGEPKQYTVYTGVSPI